MLSWIAICPWFAPGASGRTSEPANADRLRAVAEKMKTAFEALQDYTCEVEQVYYKNGVEDHRYYFKYYFQKEKKIRIDFSYPQTGVIISYTAAEEKATVVPFRSLPALKFRLSIDSPFIQTFTGQRITQTDIGYFAEFLFRNLPGSQVSEWNEEPEQVSFGLLALDYLKGKSMEKYRIFISKKNWFPDRIERLTLRGEPIEVSIIRNYLLNPGLDDAFFRP